MTEWTGEGASPDRVDALSHGVREMLAPAASPASTRSPAAVEELVAECGRSASSVIAAAVSAAITARTAPSCGSTSPAIDGCTGQDVDECRPRLG
jgi:hypothetical protein